MFGFGRRKAADFRRGGGFLSRLARDSRGNTLAIVGAALIPLTAMIGSGVDMSRAYMAKTRLQSACDAKIARDDDLGAVSLHCADDRFRDLFRLEHETVAEAVR